MFGGKKDVLYSYLSQDDINWRKGDIPHNLLASNESNNAERSQEKQIANSTDSR